MDEQYGQYETHSATTDDKTQGALVVSGLEPETTYFFVVRTVTTYSPLNWKNVVLSELSAEVSATTLAATIRSRLPRLP